MTGNLTRNWQGWGPRVSLRHCHSRPGSLLKCGPASRVPAGLACVALGRAPGRGPMPRAFHPVEPSLSPGPGLPVRSQPPAAHPVAAPAQGPRRLGVRLPVAVAARDPALRRSESPPVPWMSGGLGCPASCTQKMLAVVGARVGVPLSGQPCVQKWWGLEWDSG